MVDYSSPKGEFTDNDIKLHLPAAVNDCTEAGTGNRESQFPAVNRKGNYVKAGIQLVITN